MRNDSAISGRRFSSISSVTRTLTILSLAAGAAGWGGAEVAGADLLSPDRFGLRVPRGFEVTMHADSVLADDIYAMTINPRGEVVVTGRGYIRTLIDEDDDGVADRVVEFGETTTGGMGLCFDGDDLLFVGDGGLWRVRDANGDNRADGPAVRLLEVPFAEHGAHAIRRGPDGGLYLMVGNETKLTGYVGPASPGARVEGGALLHLPPGGAGGFRVLAHGFRNAYDFDFNREGDVFTWDSDAEGDVLLPWYVPTRLYHVAPGGHHGWRLDGWKRGWARPEYSPDTVEILARTGRASPTGVACYRHLQFPERYWDGLFMADWTFGKILFAPLEPEGSSYATTPEVFLEAAGTVGFAPTDVAVGRDGALFISTGGRRAHGAVYRVDYVADLNRTTAATNWMFWSGGELFGVLDAPQPQEEWSRRLWGSVAQRLGPGPFAVAAMDRRVSVERRLRAVEWLTEMTDGLGPNVALACARSEAPEVRARTAWSLGLRPPDNAAVLLAELARDDGSAVRVAALQALRDQSAGLPSATLQQAAADNLDHADRRVRQAAGRLAAWLPEANWNSLLGQVAGRSAQARLTLALARLERAPIVGVDVRTIDTALGALPQAGSDEGQVEAVRLVQRAVGDYNLGQPSAEIFTGYEPAYVPEPAVAARIEKALAPYFPSGSATLNVEVARTLAMVQASEPALVTRVLNAISPQTDPAQDFHYLAVLARLGAGVPTNALDKVALAIVALDRKQRGMAVRSKQNWGSRRQELVQRLVERNPALVLALLQQAELVRPGNLPLAFLLGNARRVACARLFRSAVQRSVGYPWTTELVDLLSALPPAEVHPLFRRQWNNAAVRDRLILELAGQPRPEERPYFNAGLASVDSRVVREAAGALGRLPADSSTLVPALRALRRFCVRAEDAEARAAVLALVSHVTGQKFAAREGATSAAAAHEHVFTWVGQNYPGGLSQVDADDREGQAKWDQVLKNVPWARGDAGRGAAIFVGRGCSACHEGAGALGPDLTGIAGRLSATELFNAILYPSRDIAPAWRMERFRLRSGETVSGRVTFESGEAYLVQTGVGANVRLDATQVVGREPSEVSFMPGGLLTGATPQELADLYAWLKGR